MIDAPIFAEIIVDVLERLVLDCSECGRRVHWVSGLDVRAGHWAHREPAPHGAPVLA